MLLQFKHPTFATPESRVEWANLLSLVVEGRRIDESFSPYKPNVNDDTYWTVDRGNDWKVSFPSNSRQFVIRYRYNNPTADKEAALAGWLSARFGCEILGEVSQAKPFPVQVVLP